VTLDQFIEASGYTSAQVNAIPGLSDSLQAKITAITSAQQGAPGQVPWNVLMTQAQKELSSAVSNPVSYVENQYLQQATNYAQQAYLGQLTPAFESSATNFFGQANQFLQQNGISTSQIASISDQALAAGEQSAQDYLKGQQANAQFGQIFTLIADAAALIAQQPELIPLINGAGALISGDSLAKAIEVAAVSYITQQSTGPIQQYFQNTLGLNAATAKALSNAVANTVGTAVTDPKQVVNALTSGLLTSMVTATTSQIPDFNKLSNAAQQTVNTSITDFIKSSTGKGLSTQDLLSQAISIGTTAGIDALHNETATNAGYPDYKTYQAAQQGGFTSFQDYQQASSLGFTSEAAFNAAKDAGFTNATDYNAAQQLGFNKADQYQQYQSLVQSGVSADEAKSIVNMYSGTNPSTQVGPGYNVAGPGAAGLSDVAGIINSQVKLQAGETFGQLQNNGDGSFSVEINGKGKDGKEYSYTVTYDPQDPKGAISYTIGGEIDPTTGQTKATQITTHTQPNMANLPTDVIATTDAGGNPIFWSPGSKQAFNGDGSVNQADTEAILKTLTGNIANVTSNLANVTNVTTNVTNVANVTSNVTNVTSNVSNIANVTSNITNASNVTITSGGPNNTVAKTPPSSNVTIVANTATGNTSSGNITGGNVITTPPGITGAGGGNVTTGGTVVGNNTSNIVRIITGTTIDPITGLPVYNPGGNASPIAGGNVTIGGGVVNTGSNVANAGPIGGGTSNITGGTVAGGGGTTNTSPILTGSGGASNGGGIVTGGGGGGGTGGGRDPITGIGGSGANGGNVVVSTGGTNNVSTVTGTGGGGDGGTVVQNASPNLTTITVTAGGEDEGNTSSNLTSSTITGDNVAHVEANAAPIISGGGPLFIPSKYSALAQALSVQPQQKTGTTQGLTSGDEGGEIQSQETGGPRRSVWNESSLRLRDALGLE